jgi:hypothetical protein
METKKTIGSVKKRRRGRMSASLVKVERLGVTSALWMG